MMITSLLVLACQPPSVRECIERSDPDLLDRDLVDPETGRLKAEHPANLRILTINVGNGLLHRFDPDLQPYALRVYHQTYEDLLAEGIQNLRPAIVGLQEVLPGHTCLADGQGWEIDPQRTCHDPLVRDEAVRRLLGPDYAIVCDRDASVDCLAVHVEFGAIVGLPAAGYDPLWSASAGPPEGFAICDYATNECQTKAAECDSESSILWADITTVHGERIRAVHLHPSAIGDACRETQLEQAFGHATAPWASETSEQPVHTLMLGDWNMDPERLGQPVEELLYYAHVGPSRRLREHDERDLDCARVKTSPGEYATVDRVVSDFAKGRCRVFDDEHVSLGCRAPLGLFDAAVGSIGGGHWDDRMDHRAVICDLLWPEADDWLAPLSEPLACE